MLLPESDLSAQSMGKAGIGAIGLAVARRLVRNRSTAPVLAALGRHGVLMQHGGVALVHNKTPAEARQQQGLADKGVEMEWGVRPMIHPPSFQVPQLGSNKLTRRTVLQINASDAVVLEK
jgi:hypothetical protein